MKVSGKLYVQNLSGNKISDDYFLNLKYVKRNEKSKNGLTAYRPSLYSYIKIRLAVFYLQVRYAFTPSGVYMETKVIK